MALMWFCVISAYGIAWVICVIVAQAFYIEWRRAPLYFREQSMYWMLVAFLVLLIMSTLVPAWLGDFIHQLSSR